MICSLVVDSHFTGQMGLVCATAATMWHVREDSVWRGLETLLAGVDNPWVPHMRMQTGDVLIPNSFHAPSRE